MEPMRTESMSHGAKMQLLKANTIAMQRLSDRSNNASMRSSTATEIDAPAAAPGGRHHRDRCTCACACACACSGNRSG